MFLDDSTTFSDDVNDDLDSVTDEGTTSSVAAMIVASCGDLNSIPYPLGGVLRVSETTFSEYSLSADLKLFFFVLVFFGRTVPLSLMHIGGWLYFRLPPLMRQKNNVCDMLFCSVANFVLGNP